MIDKLDRPPLVYKTGAVNWGGQDWTVEMDWRRRRRRRTQCVEEEEEDTVCGGGGGGGGHSVWRRRRRTQCVEWNIDILHSTHNSLVVDGINIILQIPTGEKLH